MSTGFDGEKGEDVPQGRTLDQLEASYAYENTYTDPIISKIPKWIRYEK